jgi:intracellular septation protein A
MERVNILLLRGGLHMSLVFALQGLLPLIIFAIVDIFAGMRTAIIAAIIVSVIEAVWSWYSFGEVHSTTWLSLGLILVMGLISIRMRSDRLFKFQPVVMAVVFASVLAWFQWKGNPFMIQLMPRAAALLPEAQRAQMSDPRFIEIMARLDLLLIPTFLAHGLLVAWAATHKSTVFWLVARGVGFYVLVGMAFLVNIVLSM